MNMIKSKKWDQYFYQICNAVAGNSPCLSRQIGAIIVRDKSIISTGYNGPARGVYHCSKRLDMDQKLQSQIIQHSDNLTNSQCPRQQLGYKSGEALNLCPAVHAETNAITNAARLGVSTIGASLYLNTQIPCKDCLSNILNAGITEIICTDLVHYSEMTKWIVYSCVTTNIKLRTFDL